MNFIKRLAIKNQMRLLVSIPVFFLAVLLVTNGAERYRTITQATKVKELAVMAGLITEIAHEAQKERGMTAGFLGSSGKQFQVELPAQRSATDRKVAELRGFLQGFDAAAYGSQFAGARNGPASTACSASRVRSISGVERPTLVG